MFATAVVPSGPNTVPRMLPEACSITVTLVVAPTPTLPLAIPPSWVSGFTADTAKVPASTRPNVTVPLACVTPD